jgi:hypothetical protein
MTLSPTISAAPHGGAREKRLARLPSSVMAAQAAIYASVHGRDVIMNAPTSKRAVDGRLRGHDVLDLAIVSPCGTPPPHEGRYVAHHPILSSVIPAFAGMTLIGGQSARSIFPMS